MLEGIVAAGFHCCFFGTGRGWLRAGTGTAALALGGFFLAGIRPAVPLLTALWIMLTGFWLHEGRREEVFLAGGLWLMALALAEGLGAVQGLAGLLAGRETELAAGLAAQVRTGEMGAGNPAAAGLRTWMMREETLGSVWENAHFPGEAQAALAAALILMAALHLLGRGGLHPLWMAALTLMWLLAGFLGSIEYARPWQDRVMGLALYLTAGGLLACQQVFCARQELERAFWENGRGEWPGYPGSAGNPGGAKEPENPEAPAAGPPEKAVRSLAGKRRKKGGDAPAAAAGASFTGGARDWRQAADREFRRMQIFEHDFRHYLDMVAALYEENDLLRFALAQELAFHPLYSRRELAAAARGISISTSRGTVAFRLSGGEGEAEIMTQPVGYGSITSTVVPQLLTEILRLPFSSSWGSPSSLRAKSTTAGVTL